MIKCYQDEQFGEKTQRGGTPAKLKPLKHKRLRAKDSFFLKYQVT